MQSLSYSIKIVLERGQNVRAGMEEILKDYGIDRRAHQSGDVQGNGCQRLMSDSNNILREITNFLEAMSAG